jgi:hypothetical protein
MSGVWHAIVDNSRPVTVWIADLAVFYLMTSGNFGESWRRFSWIQLLGLVTLMYGTLIYNGPDTPSIRLQGQWYALGLDLTPEYAEIELQRNENVPRIIKWIASAVGRRVKFG